MPTLEIFQAGVVKYYMWIVGHCNMPHIGQDTNVAIEIYHSFLKVALHANKARAHGRCIDWTIHQLAKDVFSHYSYQPL